MRARGSCARALTPRLRYEYECERKLSVPLSLWKNSRRVVVEDEAITIRAHMRLLRYSLVVQTVIINNTNTLQNLPLECVDKALL